MKEVYALIEDYTELLAIFDTLEGALEEFKSFDDTEETPYNIDVFKVNEPFGLNNSKTVCKMYHGKTTFSV